MYPNWVPWNPGWQGPSRNEMSTGSDLDLSRESVIGIFKQADNDALARHTARPGSDGTSNLRVLCGCRLAFTLEDWTLHIKATVQRARKPVTR